MRRPARRPGRRRRRRSCRWAARGCASASRARPPWDARDAVAVEGRVERAVAEVAQDAEAAVPPPTGTSAPTRILPSGCTATALALTTPGPALSVSTLPPSPKLASSTPSGDVRTSAMPCTKPSLAMPAKTSLPSGATAVAVAADRVLPTAALVAPPVPNPPSGAPAVVWRTALTTMVLPLPERAADHGAVALQRERARAADRDRRAAVVEERAAARAERVVGIAGRRRAGRRDQKRSQYRRAPAHEPSVSSSCPPQRPRHPILSRAGPRGRAYSPAPPARG